MEFDEVLLWDFVIDPRLAVSDKSDRQPRGTRPKTTDDRLDNIERDFAALKLATQNAATRDDLGKIEGRLDTIINDIEAIKGSKGFWKWFWEERSWTIATALVTVPLLITLSSFVLGSWIDQRIDQHLSPIARDIRGVSDRIARIEGRLKIQDASNVVNSLSGAPTKDLREHSGELKKLKSELAKTDKQLPNFYPTAFQLITLTSKSLTATPPPQGPELTFKDSQGMRVSSRTVELIQTVSDAVFTDCVITLDPSVRLYNVLFVNCVFFFPTNQFLPPPNLKRIADELLEADLSRAKITTS